MTAGRPAGWLSDDGELMGTAVADFQDAIVPEVPRVSARQTILTGAIGLVVVIAVASPLLFTNRSFGPDLTNNIWMGWVRAAQLGRSLGPSYFVNTSAGVFNPLFAFYGGPDFTILGIIDHLFGGHILVAFEVTTTAVIAAAYTGLYRCARLCGASSILAHLPAIAVATSPYYLSSLYGGDWTEFVAISAIPFFAASLATVARDAYPHASHIAILLLSTVVLTGSNNLVLIWAALFGAAVLIPGLALGWRPRVTRQGVINACAAALCGVGLNCWALVPLIAFGGHTAIAALPKMDFAPFLDTARMVLSPVRYVSPKSTSPEDFVAIPTLFLGLATIITALAWRRLRPAIRRGFVLAAALIALVVVLVLTRIWVYLPKPFSNLQFGLRLDSYGTYGVGAVAAVAALAVDRLGRWQARVAREALLILVLASMAMALSQIWVHHGPDGCPTRSCALLSMTSFPQTWYAGADYSNATERLISVAPARKLTIQPSAIGTGDRYSANVPAPPGQAPILTNIVANDDLVTISGGLEVIGRSAAGTFVVRRLRATSKTVPIDIRQAATAPVDLGLALTTVSAIIVLANGASIFAMSRRRRRRSQAAEM